MKNPLKYLIISTILVFIFSSAGAQYSDYKTMSQNITSLGNEYPSLCSVKTLVKTAGGKDIMAVTIGTGDKDNKPAIAIVGGVEGSYVLGPELAYGFASSLLRDAGKAEIKSLLEKMTFYILPNVSPDATEQFFSDLKYERNINARSTDDDRDFVTGEDPFEDLNHDGMITQIRVKDPEGTWRISKKDKRVMLPADLSKGETGDYKVMSEGIDNDQDGKFNEDGEGGVDFNRNFTYDYEEYGLNAGLYPVSEPEVKAVADFLYDRFNIYAVFAFGPQDNLGQPPGAADNPRSGRRIVSIMKSDEVINRLVSDTYHKITGAKGSPPAIKENGNFADWVYYHYGRYSFSTPGWWFPADKGQNREEAFLEYAASHGMNDVFVPWTEINDPDFPGKTVEAGGMKPFSMIDPPADTIPVITENTYRFIIAVAEMHPELEFINTKVEDAGENIYRISLDLHNRGVFATCTEAGDRNIWTRIMRISIEPGRGQSLLSGDRVARINRLEGDRTTSYSWLVRGKGHVKITAGALNTGTITSDIELQ
ncbi:MAG TPA: M14 family metallopeptidase [Bacteroidales bacterium]|nr:M14 family metallopeptidase [Bacteroidales bacterium]